MKKIYPIFLVVLIAFTNVSLVGAQALNASWAKASGAEENFNKLVAGTAGTFYTINTNGKYLAKYDASGTELWSKSNSALIVRGIYTDASNNIYISGAFNQTIVLGSVTLENTNPGDYNVFVIKFNSDGEVLSTIVTGQTSNLSAAEIAVDADGNVYLAGYSSGSITFGSTTVSNVYLVKLNATGVTQWANGFTASIFIGRALVVLDNEDKPYVGGYFRGSLTIGSTNLSSSNNANFFLAKYNTDGTSAWAASCGSTGDDSPTGMISDGNGNIYLCGTYNGKYSIAKFNKTTQFQWDVVASGANQSEARQMTMDEDGNFYVTGYFYGQSIGFDEITLLDEYGLSRYQAIVVKYNSNFTALWAGAAGATGEATDERGTSICAVEDGVVIAGTFAGETFTLGGTTMTNTPDDNTDEAFLAKIGADNVTPILSYSTHTSVNVFPNPTQGKIQLSGLQKGTYQVKVSTLNGQTIYQSQISDVNASIEVSGDYKGLYLLEISNGKYFSGVAKLILE